VDVAPLHLQVDPIDGHKALELLDQVVGLENDVFGHKVVDRAGFMDELYSASVRLLWVTWLSLGADKPLMPSH
jgi:hypothetical protein